MNSSEEFRSRDGWSLTGIFFVAAFMYFCFIGNYVLFFQETQSLFIFSRDYLIDYLQKPGAPLDYAARFLTQFYPGKITGSLIIACVLSLPAVLLFRVISSIEMAKPFRFLLPLIPSFLLMILQANYFHLMVHNLGFILILLFYMYLIFPGKRFLKIIAVALFPLFYYFAGAYAFVFALIVAVHCIFYEKSRHPLLFPSLIIVAGAASFLVSWKFIFLQPLEQFILFPLPLLENPTYRIIFSLLAAIIVFYPLILRLAVSWKNQKLNVTLVSSGSVFLAFAALFFMVSTTYNSQTARVIELERLIFAGKWEQAVKFHEKKPSMNLVGQYFYNIALSESDQLCDRLFRGRQDFGTNSLVLPWGDEHLSRGAYLYYSIGLINEAHRWAYEEMVVYGFRAENLKILTKTSLITGDYRMAAKYAAILKKTVFYRRLGKEYEHLAGNPDLISSHPELGEKLKLLPGYNFFVQFNEPLTNLPLMLMELPYNRKAFEYYMAALMLSKNVEGLMTILNKLKDNGYTAIPHHIEEAVMVYYNSVARYPDLGGMEISKETATRFSRYFTAYVNGRKNQAALKPMMEAGFGDTFWYYFHFK